MNSERDADVSSFNPACINTFVGGSLLVFE
jgi:hypothetical protein